MGESNLRTIVGDWTWRKKFISDVFHTLSQPLTALQCSLELSLRKKHRGDPIKAVQEALCLVKSAIDSAKFVRMLAEAEDPGDLERVRVADVVREVRQELQPVAEAQGSRILCRTNKSLEVCVDAARLQQALFLFADLLLQRAGTRDLCIVIDKKNSFVEIQMYAMIHVQPKAEIAAVERDSRAEVLARQIIQAAAGEVCDVSSPLKVGRNILLPLAPNADLSGCLCRKHWAKVAGDANDGMVSQQRSETSED